MPVIEDLLDPADAESEVLDAIPWNHCENTILLRERNLSEGWRTFSFISGTESFDLKKAFNVC